jgi:hypothetical protein
MVTKYWCTWFQVICPFVFAMFNHVEKIDLHVEAWKINVVVIY